MELIGVEKIKKITESKMKNDFLKKSKLRSSVERYGQLKPIIVDSQYNLIEGHNLYDILLDLGFEKVWVVIPKSNKSSDQIYAEVNLLQADPRPVKFFECFRNSDLEDNSIPFEKQDILKFINLLDFDPSQYSKDRKNPGVEFLF